MKIQTLNLGSGHCEDCHRGARLVVQIPTTRSDDDKAAGKTPTTTFDLRLCPRCAAYLASRLLERIDQLRQPQE